MYNRYIPQPDGSHRRNRMPDMRHPTAPPLPPSQPVPPTQTQPCNESLKPKSNNIGGFLRQLLPKEFDTGDLIIVLLLLLIAGDSQESRSNALLTLALYFIL